MKDTGNYLNDREFFRVEEVAELFGVTKRTVRVWISEGRLEVFRPSKQYLVKSESVRNFLISGNCTKR